MSSVSRLVTCSITSLEIPSSDNFVTIFSLAFSREDFDKLIQFINDNYDIYNIIKRKPNYKTLIYGTIKTEKDYKTLTEGVNMIMETESVNDLKI